MVVRIWRKPLKLPKTPPPLAELLSDTARVGRVVALLGSRHGEPVAASERYLHWEELVRRPAPDGLDAKAWWLALKLQRRQQSRRVPLVDAAGEAFWFALSDPIPEHLLRIDQGAAGRIQATARAMHGEALPQAITHPETRDRYVIDSIIAEAITSSQLEGAATTRAVANEMLRSGRSPRDRSERMILNNFQTMQRIGAVRDKPLTPALVFELHRLVTDDTLDVPDAAGRFRRPDERVVVGDDYGTVFHTPPPAETLPERMEAMCAFANGETPKHFVHPVLRAIIVHFWLAWDHPFVDGNGRTARALFYWSMLRQGYWLFEFVSISEVITRAPTKYGRAFLYTESDENDLTYFVLYHLEVMEQAIAALHAYIDRQTRQIHELETHLHATRTFNHRQRALLAHALRHPGQPYTVAYHQNSHGVVYETARTDLLELAGAGLLTQQKVGRRWEFRPAPNLAAKLDGAADHA